ncbi:hypothetical protein BY458DRAFT_468772 [Sporodiniella umbellata]|nr:hypothetical protein BY458DRAFT_468772 [Sporodiniella umbellata]
MSVTSNEDSIQEARYSTEEECEEECEEEYEEEYDEDEDDEDEPKLRYRRVAASVKDILEKDTASTIRVSEKFVAMGTHWGALHILDFEGNLIKSFKSHAATVNSISIDKSDEYIASASDDGKVFIYALYSAEIQEYNYKRPIKAVALDPFFARKSTRQFVSGGMAEQLVMSEKGWLGQKDSVLHANEGPIYAIQWRQQFIAWANDTGVKIYDTTSGLRITYIDRPDGSPRADLYKCRLCWKNDTTLLIGWADTVKVAIVRSNPTTGPMAHYVEIVQMFQTDYMISGIVPFNDTIILLSYLMEEEDEEENEPVQQQRKLAMRPELHIINEESEEVSADVLPLHGYEYYQANDYVLDFLIEEDMFYVMGPKDLIAARSRDQDDHIEWLMEHSRFGEALEAARNSTVPSKRFSVNEIGQSYLHWLIKEKQFDQAAHECKTILEHDKSLWEDWVFRFVELGELKAIAPYIPIKDPQLSSTVYEIALVWFLKSDQVALRNTIQKWPKTLYNLMNVIVAVEDKVKSDTKNIILLECLADLYTYNNQLDKAIEYNLRLRRPNAFQLIEEYNMFDAVKDKALLMMELDQDLLKKEEDSEMTPTKMPAVQLLVKNTDAIPPEKVVKQLGRHRQFLHIYLDALFNRDRHLGYQFHDTQVELYAEYDRPKLLDFLRASHYISLDKAYKKCEDKDLVPEMVYLLGRMGDNKKALMLIIKRLDDVQRAIDFAKEQKDYELWEDLLAYSMDKPKFIRGLLENVGTEIDPLRLVERIPNQLKIPGLKAALLKILQDYNLQMSLHEGCEKILVSDSVFLADKMYKAHKRGIQCNQEMLCSLCDEPVFDESTAEDVPNSVIFFCRHAYHEKCLASKEDLTVLDEDNNPGSLSNKVSRAAVLKSSQNIGCPLCKEQAAGGNAFVNRMKSTRKALRSPGSSTGKTDSIRSFGTVRS